MTGSQSNRESGASQCEKCRNARDDRRRTLASIPYALAVPLLVVMAHSAVTDRGWPLKLTLLANLFHPLVLLALTVIAIASLFVLKHFVDTLLARWVALLGCVVVFTAVARLLTPGLTH